MTPTVNRKRPHRTIVAVECTETLAVRGEPGVDDLILGRGEEEITLGVEDDLSERTLVTCMSARDPVSTDFIAVSRPRKLETSFQRTLKNNRLL